jgi:acylphosphatase
MDQICVHCYVSGRVQGVFFRRETQRLSIRLGLTGWARNTEDHRVEVVICGKKKSVYKLVEWLSTGPDLAQVSGVEKTTIPYQVFNTFDVV